MSFKEYCWGYPFDWVWRGGTIKRQTPLITTTPYVYKAFLQVRTNFTARDRVETGSRVDRAARRNRYQGFQNIGKREQLLLTRLIFEA